jgi:hypothetical protein
LGISLFIMPNGGAAHILCTFHLSLGGGSVQKTFMAEAALVLGVYDTLRGAQRGILVLNFWIFSGVLLIRSFTMNS